MFTSRRSFGIAAAAACACAAPAMAQFSSGPDVVYSDCGNIQNYGAVGGVNGYALASDTCNIGDQDLDFGFGSDGSPVLAMNAFRFSDGMLMQIGMSWCKTACCAFQSNGCGLGCSPGSGLGPGCLDAYSAGWNGSQSNMSARSSVNAWTGSVSNALGGTGDAKFKRLQIAQSDLSVAGASYFIEGAYVARDDAPAGNHYNNNSYRPVNVGGGFSLFPTGSMNVGAPAIYAWQDMDPSVQIVEVDVPGEGRFVVGSKATQMGSEYRYEYAIYNLNSDRAAGAFSVPVGAGANVSSVDFHDVDYHSGEIYDNTDWSGSKTGPDVLWTSPQTHAQNPNSNALRWGTMYTFWFKTDAAPAPGGVTATIGLFKPHNPFAISVNVVGPQQAGASCPADWNGDGNLNDQDFFDWINDYFNQNGPQGQFDFNGDGNQNDQDWFDFVNAFFNPAPGCLP